MDWKKNVCKVEGDLLGLGLQGSSRSECGREKKKETEKGDCDRSEFVEGFYFLQILILHRLFTLILFNKNTSFLCNICKK